MENKTYDELEDLELKIMKEIASGDYIDYNELIEESEKIHIHNCLKKEPIEIIETPIKIYLAGKISKNDWREPIVGYRCLGLYYDNVMTPKDIINYSVKYNNDTIITGPWFLSCDHGCYHGDNSHGLGINKLGCPDACGPHFSEEDVYKICKRQIENSDIIFAYIYDNTCYGTIYEIAYALSIYKQVIIIFNNEKLMSDMWFMCQEADIVDTLGHKTIKDKFDEIINNIRDTLN